MSREHHKNLVRGISQSLIAREQPARNSRHNQPRTRNRKPHTDSYVTLVASGPTSTYGKKNVELSGKK